VKNRTVLKGATRRRKCFPQEIGFIPTPARRHGYGGKFQGCPLGERGSRDGVLFGSFGYTAGRLKAFRVRQRHFAPQNLRL
jgi:hypothetical protein